MNLCVSGQLYDAANVALNNPLRPSYSSESDQAVCTSQAQHPRHAMNYGQVQVMYPHPAIYPGQVMYPNQVMYPGQAMHLSPVLNPCQVMGNSEAVEPVSPPVSTLATMQESSLGMADQSQFLNAHKLLGHQECRSNDKVITDSRNTKRTMIKVEQQERPCDAIDDVIITDCIIPRKRKFKVENSREAQSKESYIEETDKQTLETQDHSSVLKEPHLYTTLEDQDPYALLWKHKSNLLLWKHRSNALLHKMAALILKSRISVLQWITNINMATERHVDMRIIYCKLYYLQLCCVEYCVK